MSNTAFFHGDMSTHKTHIPCQPAARPTCLVACSGVDYDLVIPLVILYIVVVNLCPAGGRVVGVVG